MGYRRLFGLDRSVGRQPTWRTYLVIALLALVVVWIAFRAT
jgi:hypothetical protein